MKSQTPFSIYNLHLVFPFSRFYLLLFVALMLHMEGCSDDFEPILIDSSNTINLKASVSNEWGQNYTCSNSSGNSTPKDTVFAMESHTSESYYLHTRNTFNNGNPFDEDASLLSRGIMMNMDDYDSFGLFAGIYEDAWDESTCGANYIYNEECNHIENNSFATQNPYFWPGMGQKIRFWGYAPFNHQNITLPSINSLGSPTITYTVPHNNDEQIDIITVMADGAKDGNGAQNLIFNHALTAIQFVLADDVKEGSIKRISINGVYSTASTVIGESLWFNHCNIDDFSLDFNPDFSTGDSNNSTELAVDENTFIMIPQILPTDAEIVVEFTDITNTTRELRATIENSEWKAGYIITYHISTNSILYTPVVELSENSYTFPFSAGWQTKEFSLISYTEVSKAGQPTTYRQEPFTYELLDESGNILEFSDDNPPYITAYSMMIIDDVSDSQTDKPTSYTNLSVTALTKYGDCIELKNSYDLELQSQTVASGIVNLAGATGSETTANCYIVDAPGKYSFPLVYGNALVGGSENTKAYTNQKPSSNTFLNYPNYKGNPITKAHILEDNDVVRIGVGNPILLWQDQKGLIQDVLLHDGYIEFNVPQKNIREGNALIAICDNNGDIIWSWHIWITIPKNDIVVNNDKFMGSYIGYCHPHEQYYPERNVTLRITQVRTGHFEDISLKLSKGVIPDVGNSVLYQWGRKDPLPGLVLDMVDKDSNTEIGSLNKSVYSIDNSTINIPTVINRRISIAESILYPTAQAATSSNATIWHELLSGNEDAWYTNLWDAKETGSSGSSASTIEKTIYDPSPVGYSILSPRIVSYFKSAVTNINEEPSLNYNVTINGTSVSFPFTLRRDYTGDYDEEFKMTAFYIWGSPNQSYSMLHPINFGESGAYVAKWPLKNVALPVLPMRQN